MSPIKILEDRLGREEFLKPSALVRAGIFGSRKALINAIEANEIPYIRVTRTRILINREALLMHLRKGFCEK